MEQVESTEDPISPIVSASYRKLTINNDDLLSNIDASAQPPVTPGSSSDSNKLSSFHYLLLGSSILETILSVVGACPICSCKELEFCNNISKKKGLANCLEIKCKAAGCNFLYSTYSSKRVNKKNYHAGLKPFDINARSIIAFVKFERDIPPWRLFLDT